MSTDSIYALDPQVPQHIAIIMDGNGRWAKARGLPRTAGHKKGADAVRAVVKACGEMGVDYLTLYAFSSENWSRPQDEVSDLMALLRWYLKKELAELHKQGIRLRVIGDRSALADDIVSLIENAEQKTAANTKMTLIIAISYGAHQEIVHAVQKLAEDVKAGTLEPSDITASVIEQRLYTTDLPAPDLIIRTSGEQRLSNFMLWQAAYSEFLFVDTLWPNFGRDDLSAAISEFQRRDRRFGGVDEPQ